jgi:hypothetical protein
MVANTSSIDDQLHEAGLALAECVECELSSNSDPNIFESDILYKAEMFLSLWRDKCYQMRMGTES